MNVSYSAMTSYATDRANFKTILEAALTQQAISIFDKIDESTRAYNAKESAKANQAVEKLCEAFRAWIKSDGSRKNEIETAFNKAFNSIKLPEHNGDHLTFPGLATGAGGFIPRSHQRDVVARLLTEQAGLIAHAVGFGKTLELTLTAFESKRTGLATKPCLVCDNASYSQFVDTIRRSYPQANLLVANTESISEKNRDRFLSQAATGNWDLIVMAQSHFDRIPNSPATEAKYFNKQLEELRRTKIEVAFLSGRPLQQRFITKALENEEQKLIKRLDNLKLRADDCLYWEQMGVDLLLIDECHKYKKIPFATNHRRVKGIDTNRSQRGERLLMKAMEIQGRRNGRGLIGASGTPVTNTMAEAWNLSRLFKPESATEFSVETFDEFVAAFCTKVTAMELNESNMKWRNVERLSKFVNGSSFIHFVRSAMDVKMDSSALNLSIPKLETGDIELAVVELTDETADILEGLSEIYEMYEKSTDKREFSWVPIMLMQVGAAASIDPRLIDPEAPDNPVSLVNTAVKEIVKIHGATEGAKSVQCVFLDRYNCMDTSILNTLKEGGLKAYKPEYDDADAAEGADATEEKEIAAPVVANGWNLYRDIRDKLIASGIPANQIAIVNDAKTDDQRKEMFNKANSGEIRVIMGSTAKLGTGVNIQTKLYAAHHIDPAGNLTPASMTQRNGRLLRDGNENKMVRSIYYGMKDTVTPGIYDRLRRKDAFISQVFSGKGVGMEFEDCGELRLEEMKAALISDKRQLQRAELIAQIREEKMKQEIAAERARSLGFALKRNESLRGLLIEKTLVRAEALATRIKASVSPVDLLADGANGRKLETVTFQIGDGEVKGGSVKEISKLIDAQIAAWKKEKMGGAVKYLGSIHLNGLRMSIRKELEGVTTNESKLIVEVPNPLSMGDTIGNTTKFGSAEALYKVLRSRYDMILNEPSKVQELISHTDKDIETARQHMEKCEKPDYSVVNEMQKRIETLEQDMRDNPAKRRGGKSAAIAKAKSEALADSQQGSGVDFNIPQIEISVTAGAAL